MTEETNERKRKINNRKNVKLKHEKKSRIMNSTRKHINPNILRNKTQSVLISEEKEFENQIGNEQVEMEEEVEVEEEVEGEEEEGEEGEMLMESETEIKMESVQKKKQRPKAISDDYPWLCVLCDNVMASLQQLRTHYKEKHNKPPSFKCCQCTKVGRNNKGVIIQPLNENKLS